MNLKKQIENFVRRLLPENWSEWSLEERRRFWSDESIGGTTPRRTLCVREIWQEMLGQDIRELKQAEARAINKILRGLPYWRLHDGVNCGPLYGRQRGFRFDFLTYLADKKERSDNAER